MPNTRKVVWVGKLFYIYYYWDVLLLLLQKKSPKKEREEKAGVANSNGEYCRSIQYRCGNTVVEAFFGGCVVRGCLWCWKWTWTAVTFLILWLLFLDDDDGAIVPVSWIVVMRAYGQIGLPERLIANSF